MEPRRKRKRGSKNVKDSGICLEDAMMFALLIPVLEYQLHRHYSLSVGRADRYLQKIDQYDASTEG